MFWGIAVAKILAAVAITGAVVGTIAYFWDSIREWLQDVVQKVKNIIEGIVYGCRVFAKKIREGILEISKHYSKKGTKWQEYAVMREIDESEVPEEILAKVGRTEVDLTDDFSEALKLEV